MKTELGSRKYIYTNIKETPEKDDNIFGVFKTLNSGDFPGISLGLTGIGT